MPRWAIALFVMLAVVLAVLLAATVVWRDASPEHPIAIVSPPGPCKTEGGFTPVPVQRAASVPVSQDDAIAKAERVGRRRAVGLFRTAALFGCMPDLAVSMTEAEDYLAWRVTLDGVFKLHGSCVRGWEVTVDAADAQVWSSGTGGREVLCPTDAQPLATASPRAGIGDGSETRCTGSAARPTGGKHQQARLVITPCRVVVGKAPRLVIVNTGETALGYSFSFKLEKRIPSGWRWVNRRQAFRSPLLYLEPEERSDPEPIAVYFNKPTPMELHPGIYRVTKELDLAAGKPPPPTMRVNARFRVVAS